MRAGNHHRITLGGCQIEYRLVASRSVRRLRLRVGLRGIEVLQPLGRTDDEVSSFLVQNAEWVLGQIRRVERLRNVRVADRYQGEILFRGERTRVRIEAAAGARGNLVTEVDGEIVVRRGSDSRTPVARSLENWLRRQARAEIERELETVLSKIKQRPHRIYVMGQRTKWGNCSAGQNLSFNWRLILAPHFVLRYLVTHEAVHLAVPDHSAKFWLTVQSLCPETERAKQWLSANGLRIAVNLDSICTETVSIAKTSIKSKARRA